MRRVQPTDLNSIRANNLSLVLNLIRGAGSISRAGIVRQTRLSATTVSSLVNVLLASGFVHESGMAESSGGRPPILLQFDYKFRHVLGIDMGATHLTALVMDLQGHVVTRRFCKFDVMNDPPGATAAIQTLTHEVLETAGLAQDAILGVGIAVPAPLEGKRLDRLSSIILPAWEGHDLVAEIRAALDFPVYLDNDANAGVIAEKWWGYGQAFANLAYIKLGTGVGSGLIVKNEIYRGAGGTAGEIGHTTIDTSGPLCRCGNHGCLEGFAGGPAIIAEVSRRRAENGQPVETTLTMEAITAGALAGDPICRQVIERVGGYVGIAIANLLNLFNPGLIVLGGELTAAGPLLLDPVRASVARRTMPKAAQEVTITVSRLGNDTVAIGGATLAIQHAFQPSNLAAVLQRRVDKP